MKNITKKIIALALDADDSVLNFQKSHVLEILENQSDKPVKIYLTQQKAAEALSVSRQTIYNMVQRGILHPVDINGQGLMRYRIDELQGLEPTG